MFSHVRKFHTLLPERSAIKQYDAGCFYLPGANDTTWDKTRYFMRWFDGIEHRAAIGRLAPCQVLARITAARHQATAMKPRTGPDWPTILAVAVLAGFFLLGLLSNYLNRTYLQ